MKIEIRNLSFGYAGKPLFDNFSASLDGGESGRPLALLGPSGCGKTTLLKLMGGLLAPQKGEICFCGAGAPGGGFVGAQNGGAPKIAFVFQEPRLLPWLTAAENASLPLEKVFGREEARKRAERFLSLVSLGEYADAFPDELSGGQAQRASMARAFAWPAQAVFMDEPFQSLDLPLRKSLMDLTLSLLAKEARLLIAVTHDPREAVYLGGRVVVLGRPGEGAAFDRAIDLAPEDRAYGSAKALEIERELIAVLERLAAA